MEEEEKEMKLFLKNGKLYVREPLGPMHQEGDYIKFETESFKDNHNYTFEYTINNGPFKPIKNNRIPLDVDCKTMDKIKFTVRRINLSNKEKETFETDYIPICIYLYLGTGIETMYPNVIEKMQKEIQELKQRVEALESEGDLI